MRRIDCGSRGRNVLDVSGALRPVLRGRRGLPVAQAAVGSLNAIAAGVELRELALELRNSNDTRRA
jgi:hypothetical protein